MKSKKTHKPQRPKVEPPLDPAQERQQAEQLLVDVLTENIRERSDPRSIELLGKMRRFDLFTRPDRNPGGEEITNEVAKRLAEIADMFEAQMKVSAETAKQVLACLGDIPEEERKKLESRHSLTIRWN